MTNENAVDIVKGDTKNDTRSRRFQGFNTPLLPEILIGGQIAQEGIDVHRQCSHVVHYDLAWNPATSNIAPVASTALAAAPTACDNFMPQAPTALIRASRYACPT